MSDSGYGPGAIVTPANFITVARLLVSPFFFVALVDHTSTWPLFFAWFGLCASDGVDGYLARRHGATRSGAFLDPLADKVLVLGAMAALVAADVFGILPVALIAARELGISLFRTWLASDGLAVPARKLAKWKTVVQQFSVAFAVFPPTADIPWMYQTVLWVAVALTLVTGAQYLHDGRRAGTRMEGT